MSNSVRPRLFFPRRRLARAVSLSFFLCIAQTAESMEMPPVLEGCTVVVKRTPLGWRSVGNINIILSTGRGYYSYYTEKLVAVNIPQLLVSQFYCLDVTLLFT